jgi:phenylpyruvate tautomerase PptA (4-oxalocrotonate tautomerase family)
MPLVRIDLSSDTSAEHRAAISQGVHDALVATFSVPEDDRFHVISEHTRGTSLVHTPRYLGVDFSERIVFIEIVCTGSRDLEQKRRLYAAIADNLAANPGLRREDVVTVLVEVKNENWSFGNGIAAYV